MKKYLFILSASLLAAACEKNNVVTPYPEPYQYLSPYSIAEYLDGTFTLETIKEEASPGSGHQLNDEGIRLVFTNTILYQDPNVREAKNSDKYLECAAKNKDLMDREYWMPYNFPSTKRAFSFNWRSIVVTSNKRYDAAHPAGKPLNDLIAFCGLTFGPYVLSGYNDEINQFNYISRYLSQCTEEELSMLSANTWDFPRLYFLEAPEKIQKQIITVHIKADYGEPVRTAQIECTPTKENSLIHIGNKR